MGPLRVWLYASVADLHPLNKEHPHPSDPDPKQSEKWIWIRINANPQNCLKGTVLYTGSAP
jgi:hypothetical protein